MNENELFRLALGLSEPWQVHHVTFSLEKKRLDLFLDFPPGSRFLCPECGSLCPVHDTEEREWRHLNFFEHEAYLHARQPRLQCPEHKVKTVEVPWARPGAGFTLLFEAWVLLLIKSGMTPASAGRLVGEHDTRLWRILQHYVDQAREKVDMSEVRTVGVDETARAGRNFVTVFMDLEEKKVLFVTEGKDAETVKEFKQDLQEHGGKAEAVTEFSLDMSRAFQSGIEQEFPQAHLTFDSFHLMKGMNEAVAKVWREEKPEREELKGNKYVFLKNEWNHTEKQKAIWKELRKLNCKTNRAHDLRCLFQDLFEVKDAAEGEAWLRHWYSWATRSRLEPVLGFARTVKRHWDGVVRWFTSRISNGLLEGMNSLIQAAKARSRGFRNVKNFITMIYLIGGQLEFSLPDAFSYAHTK